MTDRLNVKNDGYIAKTGRRVETCRIEVLRPGGDVQRWISLNPVLVPELIAKLGIYAKENGLVK